MEIALPTTYRIISDTITIGQYSVVGDQVSLDMFKRYLHATNEKTGASYCPRDLNITDDAIYLRGEKVATIARNGQTVKVTERRDSRAATANEAAFRRQHGLQTIGL